MQAEPSTRIDLPDPSSEDRRHPRSDGGRPAASFRSSLTGIDRPDSCRGAPVDVRMPARAGIRSGFRLQQVTEIGQRGAIHW